MWTSHKLMYGAALLLSSLTDQSCSIAPPAALGPRWSTDTFTTFSSIQKDNSPKNKQFSLHSITVMLFKPVLTLMRNSVCVCVFSHRRKKS